MKARGVTIQVGTPGQLQHTQQRWCSRCHAASAIFPQHPGCLPQLPNPNYTTDGCILFLINWNCFSEGHFFLDCKHLLLLYFTRLSCIKIYEEFQLHNSHYKLRGTMLQVPWPILKKGQCLSLYVFMLSVSSHLPSISLQPFTNTFYSMWTTSEESFPRPNPSTSQSHSLWFSRNYFQGLCELWEPLVPALPSIAKDPRPWIVV